MRERWHRVRKWIAPEQDILVVQSLWLAKADIRADGALRMALADALDADGSFQSMKRYIITPIFIAEQLVPDNRLAPAILSASASRRRGWGRRLRELVPA